MKIELDLDYDEAVDLKRQLVAYLPIPTMLCEGTRNFIDALDNAIQNEDSRAYDRQQERLMEDGGLDDSKYRADMKAAGRAHLLR